MYNDTVEKRDRKREGWSITHTYNDTVEKRAERGRVGQSLTCTMIL